MKRQAVGVAAVAAVLLAGCAHTEALQPAPALRDPLSDVRVAAADVLLDHDVDLLEAPVCASAADDTVACSGTSLDGGRIEVRTVKGERSSMVITVGGSEIFRGDIDEVLRGAAS